jgi:hypothetical protein
MRDSPGGASPRITALGLGPAPSTTAREDRETVRPPGRRQAPEPPEPEWECFLGPESEPEPAVEPHRSAQLSGDVARAPGAPALRAPVRRDGRWPAPSLARLALARLSLGPALRAIIAALAAAAIVALAVTLGAHPIARPELRADVTPLGPSAAPMSTAPSTPEPPAPAEPTSSAPEPAPPTTRAPRAAPGKPHAPTSGTARLRPTSDVVDPWR